MKHKMPNEQLCREVDLPYQLLCRRGQIIGSRLGISERDFDGKIASTLPFVRVGSRRRYYVSAVLVLFFGETL